MSPNATGENYLRGASHENHTPPAAFRSVRHRLALALESFQQLDGHVWEGVLRDTDGQWYPIERGVPCFLRGGLRPDNGEFARRHGLDGAAPRAARLAALMTSAGDGQARTAATFSDKWRRFRSYGMEPSHQGFLFDWYCKKLGLPERRCAAGVLSRQAAGPRGRAGFRLQLPIHGRKHARDEVFAADISEAAFTTLGNTRESGQRHRRSAPT